MITFNVFFLRVFLSGSTPVNEWCLLPVCPLPSPQDNIELVIESVKVPASGGIPWILRFESSRARR